MRLRRPSSTDVLPVAVALLVALESLTHPFGRDQGLYFYIGREWALRGQLPYRDTFDVKTPGIYLLNGLSALLFGDRLWGPRLFDIVGVFALAFVSARLSVPRSEPVPRGAYGVAALAVSLGYYVSFDFWNTAQCELWCALFSLASVLVAARGERTLRAALGAGLLGGVAVLFKPPALLVCGLAALALAAREWLTDRTGTERAKSSAARIGAYALGGFAVLGLLLVYFAARGGLAALYDVLVVNNRHYVVQGRWVHSNDDALLRTREAFHAFDPLATLVAAGLAVSALAQALRADRSRAELLRRLLPFALAACSVLAVWAQMKFVWYHWGTVVAPLGLAAALLLRDARQWFSARERAGSWGAALVAFALLVCTYANQPVFDRWWATAKATAGYLRETVPRAVYLRRFDFGPPVPYSFADSEEIAVWLRAHAAPGDRVAVRGFEPQIYALSHLRAHGRFFWTTFLVRREWAYRMNDWVAEDRAVFERDPPRWVLAFSWVASGVDSVNYFYPMGYVRVADVRAYTVLEYRGPRRAR